MQIPMIAGLYPYLRNGIKYPPRVILEEISASLEMNPTYRDNLIVLAGDQDSARKLESFGLTVRRVFDDAPDHINRDTAHKMKHWMCRWALDEFGEFLWVDWDTVMLKKPDELFVNWCRSHGTPKFIHIPNYWATVNCGVYYANRNWIEQMDRSFKSTVGEPNDELLWASVLPENVVDLQEYWFEDLAVNIYREEEMRLVTDRTYFAHVKDIAWGRILRNRPTSTNF